MSQHANQPVTGAPTIIAQVIDGPVDFVSLPWPTNCGGEAVFLGRTRLDSHPTHGQLLRLEYEVYKPMAEKLLRQMALDAAGRWPCRIIRIVHAQGAVDLGKASVVIQVGTPHRGDSFEACRYLIDRLKRELPVWKRETWERGETYVPGTTVEL